MGTEKVFYGPTACQSEQVGVDWQKGAFNPTISRDKLQVSIDGRDLLVPMPALLERPYLIKLCLAPATIGKRARIRKALSSQ